MTWSAELARIAKHPYVAGEPLERTERARDDRTKKGGSESGGPESGGSKSGGSKSGGSKSGGSKKSGGRKDRAEKTGVEADDAEPSDAEGNGASQDRPENDRASATAQEDELTPLPSGGHGTPRTRTGKLRAEFAVAAPAAADADAEASGATAPQAAAGPADGYKKILLALRSHCGVDFSLYRSSTIQRRIARRLVLCRKDTLDAYALHLRGNGKELDALYSDVLISVTSFFRNPEMFDALRRDVLLAKRSDDPVRIWVLDCSTGQEAYSLAMTFAEAADTAPRMRKLQVFATDLNDTLLDKARHGLYAKSLAGDLGAERLRRFFVEEEGGWRVSKALRERVVFARQNLIGDPPFSRMDLISCRNLLIYLEPSLQKKAIPTFHFALKPEGFLLLGASESIGGFTDLFEPFDKKQRIFQKKRAATRALPPLAGKARSKPGNVARQLPPLPILDAEAQAASARSPGELNAQREADRVSVNQFAPPGVLVSAALQVLQFRGPTGAWLEPPSGKASFDVLKMAREGLMLPLRAAINEAKKAMKPARRNGVRVGPGDETRSVNLQVIPLKNLREPCFLILFEDAGEAGRGPSEPALAATSPKPRRLPAKQEAGRVAELEADLAETRDYLQAMEETHEAANEEVQAANEEVQSTNEELQSVNEELETSKEELESTNEELITVNEEMASRNVELNRVNGDLVNLQGSARLAIVLVGRDLAIRRFSPQAEKQFDLLAADFWRPLGHLRHRLVREPSPEATQATAEPLDLDALAAEVIAAVREQECDVRDSAGRWH